MNRVFFFKKGDIAGLHPNQALTPEAFPTDVPLVSSEVRNKSVFFFHDESTYNTNEDQSTQWGERVSTCSGSRARAQALRSRIL